MWKAFYEHSTLLHYPLFALLFFVAVFALMVVLAIARSRNGGLDELARMPLDDAPIAKPVALGTPDE